MTLPTVTIGLPVYNGEQHLAQCLDSVLAQEFEDFELIVSDNASEDHTEGICREYAAADRRVKYHRNERNLGAAANQNRILELATGNYFKLVSHDDWFSPKLLSRSVEVLTCRPEVVLCYWLETIVDSRDEVLRSYGEHQRFAVDSPLARERFHQWLWAFESGARGDPIYGTIRTDVAKRDGPFLYLGLQPNFLRLAELSLQGPWYTVPEHLAFRRANTRRVTVPEGLAWLLGPDHAARVRFPHWRRWYEYLKVLLRSTQLSSREKAYLSLNTSYYFLSRDLKGFAWDLRYGGTQAVRVAKERRRPRLDTGERAVGDTET
jgi:glycosyltransferase involved in cell wall biosynthesis